MDRNFTGHDKRVTLNLGLHSAVARGRVGLVEALGAAKSAGWDLEALPQEMVEAIYSNFDDDFEKLILSEYEADPSYLIDLGPTSPGVCPLCGHIGIRWVFRVINRSGGESVECGSECIVTWGISVKGAETAEEAKAVLEGQIRKAIKKLLIEAWHKETGFTPKWFQCVREALDRIRDDSRLDYSARRTVYWKKGDVRKLERFYNKNGWLNTEIRWNDLGRLVNFCRANDGAINGQVPHLDRYVTREAKAAATKAALVDGKIKTEALTPRPDPAGVSPVGTLDLPLASKVVEPAVEVTETLVDAEAAAQAEELEWVRSQAADNAETDMANREIAEELAKPVVPAAPGAPKQLTLDFGALARELVFGK